jgi:hypothetical protein
LTRVTHLVALRGGHADQIISRPRQCMTTSQLHPFALDHDDHLAVSKDVKVNLALDFFEGILAAPPTRARRVKLDRLGLRRVDLSGICAWFSEEEVWSVIRACPPDKASGPDGFSAVTPRVMASLIIFTKVLIENQIHQLAQF